jgi:polyisoprenoid-binding protein YceI
MSKRALTIIGILVALVVIAVGGWYFFIRSDAPDAPDAESAREALEGSQGTTSTTRPAAADTGAETPGTTAAAPSGGAGDVSGTWTVDTSLGGDSIDDRSFVGYKVQEELVQVGSSTAFGRTPVVSGTLTIDGTMATTVDIEADLTGLESDNAFRDRALGSQALETATFPTAVFRLTEPIDFEAVPEEGVVLEATAVGDLNLHGVVNQIEIPLQAQLVGDAIAVTGVAPVLFADHDIEPPSAPAVASVEDNGTIEIQLFFSRS